MASGAGLRHIDVPIHRAWQAIVSPADPAVKAAGSGWLQPQHAGVGAEQRPENERPAPAVRRLRRQPAAQRSGINRASAAPCTIGRATPLSAEKRTASTTDPRNRLARPSATARSGTKSGGTCRLEAVHKNTSAAASTAVVTATTGLCRSASHRSAATLTNMPPSSTVQRIPYSRTGAPARSPAPAGAEKPKPPPPAAAGAGGSTTEAADPPAAIFFHSPGSAAHSGRQTSAAPTATGKKRRRQRGQIPQRMGGRGRQNANIASTGQRRSATHNPASSRHAAKAEQKRPVARMLRVRRQHQAKPNGKSPAVAEP